MEVKGFFYETLGPLSSPTTSAASPDSYSPDSNSPERYSVFRNQVPSSSLAVPSPSTAGPDFFSLDVDADDIEDSKQPSIATTSTPTECAATREPERTLERGWFRVNSRFKSPMLQLHKEILDFCDFLSPTLEEQSSRNEAVEGVSGVVKYIWPHCKVEVFGSFKTGLYLPTSDIDVVILDSKVKTPQVGLIALSRALTQKGIAKKIQVIAKARVPIIKFIEKRSGVSFDISFDVQNGPKAAVFIKEAVNRIPPLRPLCLILKVFLQQRELNEVYSGGIGSYALLTMLIAQLQMHWKGQHFQGSKATLEQNLGILLAPENDIGKNSFNYSQIRSAFGMAFSTLTSSKTILSLGPNRSILGTIIRPDPILLERKGGLNGDMTFESLLPGAGELVQLTSHNEQEVIGNWQFDEEEEPPLPRGDGKSHVIEDVKSLKKRKKTWKEHHIALSDGKVVVRLMAEKAKFRHKSRKISGTAGGRHSSGS